MRVAHVTIKEFSGGVTGARSATARWVTRRGMVLQVRTPEGLLGQGEASPLPGYSPDDYGYAMTSLRGVDWESLPEADPSEGTDALLEQVASIVGSTTAPSARFAIETALLDLLGQRAERPISALLSDRNDANARVPLSALVGDADDPGIAKSARVAVGRGVAGIKLKVSGASTEDRLVRLRSVRAAIGDAGLRLDANGSLPADDPAAELMKFRGLGLEFIEEPFTSSAMRSLTEPPVPIALDESLQDPRNWAVFEPRLKRLGCVALVLKPMALGGFSACMRLARVAARRGLHVVVSHLFDGPVALTASAHLALAIGSRRYGSGLDVHGGLGAWPAMALPLHSKGAIVESDAPGLGLPLAGAGP